MTEQQKKSLRKNAGKKAKINKRTSHKIPHRQQKINLDDIKQKSYIDMLCHADDFTSQIRNAWRLGEDAEIKHLRLFQKAKQVFICGMGGSGIGGKLAEKYGETQSKIPIKAINGYLLPQGTDENTLVILVSHSGNTIETLSYYKQAKEKQAICAVISGGGALLKQAKENDDTYIEIPTLLFPRESTAYLTIPILLLLARCGFWQLPCCRLPEILEAVNDVIFRCNRFVLTKENQAKQLAKTINNKTPVILGVNGYMETVAYHWKTMLNENAKIFAVSSSLPEFCHNEIEAITPKQQIIILRSMAENSDLKKQIAALRKICEIKEINCENIWLMGKNTVAKALAMMLLGEYMSLYAACLNNKNCASIPMVTNLKTLV